MSITHQLFLQCLRELYSSDEIGYEQYSGELAARLLDHAWREVPAYRNRLSSAIKDQSFDLLNWELLPVLTAREFAEKIGTFAARALPSHAEDFEFITASPANPLARRSITTRIAIECERELACERHGVDLSAKMAILHPAYGAGTNGHGWSVTFPSSVWLAGDPMAPVATQLEWIVTSGARVLRTTDARAFELATEMAASGHVPDLDAVIVADTQLLPQTSSALAGVLSARLIHMIELPALGPVAVNNPTGEGYIASAGTMIVEVVDNKGCRVQSGELGELVVTPLYEYATPLIRYGTGLQAAAGGTKVSRLGLYHLASVSADIAE